MNRILIAITITIFLVPVISMAWSAPEEAMGVNGNYDDYSSSFADNSDMYKGVFDKTYRIGHSSGYTWDGIETECQVTGHAKMIVSPDGTYGFIINSDGRLYRVSSTNGIDFTLGEELDEWYDAGNGFADISFAWNSGWLLVVYHDQTTKIDNGDLDNPQTIDLDDPVNAGINWSGTVIVTDDWNGGNRDLYEWTGSGTNWSGKTHLWISSSSWDDRQPTFGELEGDETIFWSKPEGSGGGYDIWYSIRGPVNIESASLGSIKALFR